MAGDWIKMRHDLKDDPACLTLSDKMSDSLLTTIGRLFVFWSWADRHTATGELRNVSRANIDQIVDAPGFASVLIEIGWLVETEAGLSLPQFHRHNGNSAKARTLEAEAKRLRRHEEKLADNGCPTLSEKLSDQSRAEHKRERKSAAAAGDGDFFEAVNLDSATSAARRLGRAIPAHLRPSCSRDFVWQACVIASCIDSGFIDATVKGIKAGDIKKPKAYIDKVLRDECKTLGHDYKELQKRCPPTPTPPERQAG